VGGASQKLSGLKQAEIQNTLSESHFILHNAVSVIIYGIHNIHTQLKSTEEHIQTLEKQFSKRRAE